VVEHDDAENYSKNEERGVRIERKQSAHGEILTGQRRSETVWTSWYVGRVGFFAPAGSGRVEARATGVSFRNPHPVEARGETRPGAR
jgi:hypothetical protein